MDVRNVVGIAAIALAALAADAEAYAQRHAVYQGAEPLSQRAEASPLPRLALYPTKAEPAYRIEPAKPEGPEQDSEAEPFVVAVREYSRVPSYFFGKLRRASQAELGPYVLGRCWPGTGDIEILDGLYGREFDEVLRHELTHLRHPGLSEGEVRQRTRLELEGLGIAPRWH